MQVDLWVLYDLINQTFLISLWDLKVVVGLILRNTNLFYQLYHVNEQEVYCYSDLTGWKPFWDLATVEVKGWDFQTIILWDTDIMYVRSESPKDMLTDCRLATKAVVGFGILILTVYEKDT